MSSGFATLRVRDKYREGDRAVCLQLSVPAGREADFHYRAGQHIALRTQWQGEELRRTYSLCPPDRAGDLRVCVRQDAGGHMARYLSDELAVGMTIDALPPSGSFHVQNSPSNAVGFAAGIGITPLIAIATAVLESSPSSRFTLFYGSRDTASAVLAEELQALKNRFLERFALHFFMSREAQELSVYAGRIDADKIARLAVGAFDVQGADEFFVCGPGSMNADVGAALVALGADPKRIHSEKFTLEDTASPRAAAAPADAGPMAMARGAAALTTVTVRMDGRSKQFQMPQNGGVAILDAAEQAGIDLPFSCKAGVCSTCRTHLSKGKVEMVQNFALEDSELEAGFILACQSIPVTPAIELDYDKR